MTDCLLIVLEDLREYGKQIPLYDADRRECWFDSLTEVIVQLPRDDQRKAWVVCIADDLCRRAPGLSLAIAAAPLLDRLLLLQEKAQ